MRAVAPAVRDDRGSAVVEFSLVSALLVLLFLSVLQLGFVLYLRNTLVACAAEGARYGANADRGPEDAQAMAVELIEASLPDEYAQRVSAGYADVAGAPTVEVAVTADIALVSWLGFGAAMTVRGHALEEGP